MQATALARALVIASIVVANGACAGADVHKCIDTSGHVTLTDEACPSNSSIVKIVTGAANGIDTATSSEHAEPSSTYHARTSHFATLYVAPRPRGMALDVAMLKQARARLHLQDNAPRPLGATYSVAKCDVRA